MEIRSSNLSQRAPFPKSPNRSLAANVGPENLASQLIQGLVLSIQAYGQDVTATP